MSCVSQLYSITQSGRTVAILVAGGNRQATSRLRLARVYSNDYLAGLKNKRNGSPWHVFRFIEYLFHTFAGILAPVPIAPDIDSLPFEAPVTKDRFEMCSPQC